MAGIQTPLSLEEDIETLPEGTEMTSSITEKEQKSHDSKSYGHSKPVTEKNLETGLKGEHSAAEKPDDPLPLKPSDEIVKDWKMAGIQAIHSLDEDIDILPEGTEMTSSITEKDKKSHDSKSYGQCKTVTERHLETGLIGEHSAAEKPDDPLTLKEFDKTVKALESEQDRALHEAAKAGDVDGVKCLIEHGAQVDARNEVGEQALHLAAMKGHVDVVKYLIEHGAEVDAEDRWREQALHLAGHVNVLIEHGAEVEAKDWGGRQALHWAALGEHVDVVKYLIELGGQVNAKDTVRIDMYKSV